MRRFGVRCMALVMTITALMAAAQASSQELATNRRTAGDDPAVMAFRIFVVGKDLSYPADRAIVVAAFDRLACAIEGLALARNAFADADFAEVHELRREIRKLAISADTPALTNRRADTFLKVAQLLRDLDRDTGGGAEISLVEAVERSARGLDRDYPLKWEPVAMKNFFECAAETLLEIDRAELRCQTSR